MYNSCHVIRTPLAGSMWSLPADLINQFQLAKNEKVTLLCGGATAPAVVQTLPGTSGVMGLSAQAIGLLGIPELTFLQIKPEGPKKFRLGPVIGILTFPGHVPNRLEYYKVYARRLTTGLIYIFRGRGINPETNRISGYYYNPADNCWKPGEMPYPDAVIDRCYPNVRVSHRLLENVIGNGRIFNKKSMIDKVNFCKALDSDTELRKYIPETRVLQTHNDLVTMLDKHGAVFLKPVNGMKGIGIVTLEKKENGPVSYSYFQAKKLVEGEIPSAAGVHGLLIKAAGHSRAYIVQQAIRRLDYQGGPFSFRTWAMKNGQGRWVMPGMFAKAALGQGFLTNFTAGAKLVPLREIFDFLLPRLTVTPKELVEMLIDLTLKTAAILDKFYGPLGELGLDIVFDTHGKPWLIEANGNPGNIPIFKQQEYPAWRHLVFQLPVDYAVFLAGFGGS